MQWGACYHAGASVKKAAGAVEKLASKGGLTGFSWRQRGTDPHEVDVSRFTAENISCSMLDVW
jgi:hypothetical protein